MEQKTSAHYQRLHRQRLREQGLVKKEVWILPEYGAALQQLEKQMRVPGLQPESMVLIHKEGGMDNSRQAYRDIHALAGDLQQSALVQGGRLHIEVLEGADASLLVSLPEFGDLPVHVALSGDQLVVEAFLWPADQVHDRAGLNEQMLRLQKLFPFTTMALEPQAPRRRGLRDVRRPARQQQRGRHHCRDPDPGRQRHPGHRGTGPLPDAGAHIRIRTRIRAGLTPRPLKTLSP